MNTVDLLPEDVEKERLQEIVDLSAESGPDWVGDNAPGSFGCHELLDRTAMFADLLEQQIQRHPACLANPNWYLRASQAAAILHDLYQQIGAEHLEADDHP